MRRRASPPRSTTSAPPRPASGRTSIARPSCPAVRFPNASACEVRLKCENLQRAGSFKIRGAMNALLQIPEDERARRRRRVLLRQPRPGRRAGREDSSACQATIVMPENSVQTKVEATKAYGAEVVTAGVTSATRDTVAREIAEKSGAAVIPPFDDERIIAGAGTVGLEIVEEWPEVDDDRRRRSAAADCSPAPRSPRRRSTRRSTSTASSRRAGNDGEQSFHSGQHRHDRPAEDDRRRRTHAGHRRAQLRDHPRTRARRRQRRRRRPARRH